MKRNIILFVVGLIPGFFFIIIYGGLPIGYFLSKTMSPFIADKITTYLFAAIIIFIVIMSILSKKNRFLWIGILAGLGLSILLIIHEFGQNDLIF